SSALMGESEEVALPQSLEDAEQILNPALFKSKGPEVQEETPKEVPLPQGGLHLGRPIPFTKREKHSFTQWLQLTSAGEELPPKVVPKMEPPPGEDNRSALDQGSERRKKFELLDRFIENNPKIVPQESPKPRA